MRKGKPMGKRAVRILLVALIMVSTLWGTDLGSGSGAPGDKRPPYVPGELLVKYRPAVTAVASAYFDRRLGVATLRSFHDIGVQQVKLPAGMTVEQALELYRDDPDVEYAEPNYYRYVKGIPTDPDFDLLWGLLNTAQTIFERDVCPPFQPFVIGSAGADISVTTAWDTATDCSGKVVAIIDTGADYNHPDLVGNIAARGHDFVDNDDNPMDADGHGTHVAGTIAAAGNNGRGITGVCWSAQLMILRAFDAFGIATTGQIISAMAYARTHGAHVINASYGGGDFSQAERDEILNLNAAGILLIAAAGNEGVSNDTTPSYPASYNLPNIIAVAASDQNDNLACFSNYGQTSVHVAAPGTNIYSAKPGRQTVQVDDFDDNDISDWTVDASWGLSTKAYSGNHSLALGGSDGNGGDSSARPTSAVDLSGKTGTRLTFKTTGEIPSGDRLYVETAVSTSGPWTNRPVLVDDTYFFENGIFGTSSQWVNATVDLGSLDGVASLFFRLRYQSQEETSSGGGGGGGEGGCFISTLALTSSLRGILGPATARAAGVVYIDDVRITTAGVEDVYQFLNGTSMATPHVAGLAALVWSQTPTLTASEVKARILNSVERLTDLAQQVVTWGRINASSSIANVPAEPVGLAATVLSSSGINLTWENNYYGQIGFRIERKSGGGSFTEIKDLPDNITSYIDTGLSPATTYFYRVRAYIGSNLSDYSVPVGATTP